MDEPRELQRRFSHRVLPGEPSWERKIIGDSKKNAKLVIIYIYMYPIMLLYVIMSYIYMSYVSYSDSDFDIRNIFWLGIRESDIPCKKHLLQPAGCSF